MKKVLAISSIIVASILVGCMNYSRDKEIVGELDLEIYNFEHDGHDYIVFTENNRTINVIHSPDCVCRLHDNK